MDHYCYTQLATYLQCPPKYKYHYLDGWEERDDKPALIFGRVFERAVESQFLVEDSVQFFTEQWATLKDAPLEYSNGDSWEKMLVQGQQLLINSVKTNGFRSKMGARIFRSGFAARCPSVSVISSVTSMPSDGWTGSGA